MVFQVVKLRIKKHDYTYFWRGIQPLQKRIIFSGPELTDKGQTSSLFTDFNNELLFKFMKTKGNNNVLKRISENIEKYLWISSASKEYRGNNLLNKMGIKVPKAYGLGFPFKTSSPYKCVYVQKYIHNTISLEDFLDSKPSKPLKVTILKKVSQDLCCMYKNRVLLRDMFPADILIDSDNNIYWVDTNAKKINMPSRFRNLFSEQLKRFITCLCLQGVNKKELELNNIFSFTKEEFYEI